MSIWDDPDLRAGGDFISFEKIGDSVAGTIQAIRKHRFDDGGVVPQVLLVTDQGDERTVTAGQVRLKAELAQQRPEAGDHITITLTQIEPRAGGKSLKHFTVQIRKGAGQPAAAPAPQYPPQGYAPPPVQQPYGAPQIPPGYQTPPVPPAAPPQQYTPPAVPAPQAAPPAAAAPQLTAEQQAALAMLTPEQRVALGHPQ